MSNTKILTFAVLGAALVSLIDKANDNPEMKAELERFKADFDALILQNDSVSEDRSAEMDEANEVIADLKERLEKALEEKASRTDKPTIKIDGVIYQVNHGSHPYSASQIAESEDIAKSILKIEGQNVLTEVQ